MASRHLSRAIAMQSLYELDFNDLKKDSVDEVIAHNVAEFSSGTLNVDFVKQLVEGVLAKQKAIDPIIEKCAPEWPIKKITIVDRNVLRMGIYELMFSDYEEVPPKVAINEAIEIAKAYGGEASGRFINGVLGTVYRQMGEPMKDDQTKSKKKAETETGNKEKAKKEESVDKQKK